MTCKFGSDMQQAAMFVGEEKEEWWMKKWNRGEKERKKTKIKEIKRD